MTIPSKMKEFSMKRAKKNIHKRFNKLIDQFNATKF